MAGLFCGDMHVEYSLVTGKVRLYETDGKVLFDEYESIETPGWEKALWDEVHDLYLDEDRDGHGLHAFVYPLIEKYGDA